MDVTKALYLQFAKEWKELELGIDSGLWTMECGHGPQLCW